MKYIAGIVLGFRDDLTTICLSLLSEAKRGGATGINLLVMGEEYDEGKVIEAIRDILLSNISLSIKVYVVNDYEEARDLIRGMLNEETHPISIKLFKGHTSWPENTLMSELQVMLKGRNMLA